MNTLTYSALGDNLETTLGQIRQNFVTTLRQLGANLETILSKKTKAFWCCLFTTLSFLHCSSHQVKYKWQMRLTNQ